MISAFGIDHGETVSKLVMPKIPKIPGIGAGATTGARRASGMGSMGLKQTGGAHRAPGMSRMPGAATRLRTAAGVTGVNVGAGLKRMGAAIGGPAGKRAAPNMRSRIGGGLTSMGRSAIRNPYATGGGVAAGGLGAAGGGAAYGMHRRRQM